MSIFSDERNALDKQNWIDAVGWDTYHGVDHVSKAKERGTITNNEKNGQ